MPTTSGSVLLVGGEDSAINAGVSLRKTVRKKRAQGAVDLAAGQDFLFAGPAFALDEAAGNASACVGVLAVVHGEGKKSMPFPCIGRGNGSARTTVSPVGHQCAPEACLAMRPVSRPTACHRKPTATFMLGHRISFHCVALGKLVKEERWRELARRGSRAKAGRTQAHSCAPSWAASRVRQVHHGPRSCRERGP